MGLSARCASVRLGRPIQAQRPTFFRFELVQKKNPETFICELLIVLNFKTA